MRLDREKCIRITLIDLLLFIVVLLGWTTLVFAHGGGLDQSGGHNCYVGSCAGSYHYHSGGSSSISPTGTILFFLVAGGLFAFFYFTERDQLKKDKKRMGKFIDPRPPFNSKTKKFEWNGEWKQYYENGQLKSEGSYTDGTAVGPWREYYENGNLEYETNYDWKNTPQLDSYYYKNGTLTRRGYIKDGYMIGEWEHYYENGQLFKKQDAKEENRNGHYIFYHKDGSTYFEGSYKNGKPCGTHKIYFENGQLENEERFENHESIYQKSFHEDGTISMHIEHTDGKKFSKFYDQSGKLKESYET